MAGSVTSHLGERRVRPNQGKIYLGVKRAVDALYLPPLRLRSL